MSNYRLFCRGESGNSYKAALMLNLVGADWSPVFVDFFDEQSRAAFRQTTNEMGELPTLELPDGRLISQSGVILSFLSREMGMYAAASQLEQDDVLRWLLFDNHRFTPPFATLRFMIGLRGGGESVLTAHLRAQAQAAYEIVDAHLAEREYVVGTSPTIADISMAGYLYYEEDARFDRTRFLNIARWADRIKRLPGWKHPYDLMPRAIRKE